MSYEHRFSTIVDSSNLTIGSKVSGFPRFCSQTMYLSYILGYIAISVHATTVPSVSDRVNQRLTRRSKSAVAWVTLL